jgi:hypothetical protein
MAIKHDIFLQNGLQATNSWIRVRSVNVIDKTQAQATVNYYANETSETTYQTKNIDFNYSLLGSNVFSQAYNYLKTLPEFSGAMDC